MLPAKAQSAGLHSFDRVLGAIVRLDDRPIELRPEQGRLHCGVRIDPLLKLRHGQIPAQEAPEGVVGGAVRGASLVPVEYQCGVSEGKGITRIAKTLNAEHVAPPRQAKGWAPTAIREMLHRPLYTGEIVWNKTQKVVRGGTKKQIDRPRAEWLTIPAPDLQIVPTELWAAAHARIERVRKVFARSTGTGQLLGQPSRLDLESPYLLSGMARCSICGGALIAMTRDHGKTKGRRYGCSYHHKRGATICTNDVQIQQEVLDHALLQALSEALDERMIAAAVDRALAQLRSQREVQPDRRLAIERELSLIEAKEKHLVAAVSRGEAVEPLLAALKAEGERKKVLVQDLAGMDEVAKVVSLDAKRLQRDLNAQATDVRGLLSKHVPQARQMLRKLLVGRLDVTPIERNGQKGYLFEGKGSYGKLLTGEAGLGTEDLKTATSDGVPRGIRTPVLGLKGRRPRPD